MSYVLGAHSSDLGNLGPLTGVLATFAGQLTNVARSAVSQNFSRYQAYNLFRFNVSDIKSTSDSRLKTLMARDKNNELKNATPQFKAYYAACRAAAAIVHFTTKPTNDQVDTLAYEGWKTIWSQIAPATPGTLPPSTGAGVQSAEEDNTLLYVAGAVGVALLAFGLMRRRQ